MDRTTTCQAQDTPKKPAHLGKDSLFFAAIAAEDRGQNLERVFLKLSKPWVLNELANPAHFLFLQR
jgi:hypothetical protein